MRVRDIIFPIVADLDHGFHFFKTDSVVVNCSRIAIFSLLLLMETLADQMHWDFHSLKYALTPGERKCHPSKVLDIDMMSIHTPLILYVIYDI